MRTEQWRLLQLFADGGTTGGEGGSAEGSTTGEAGADAGHERLLELGVPARKLRNRAYPTPQQDAAAVEEQPSAEQKRMTWDQIKADPEYSRHLQNMVQSRLKNVKQAEEDLAKLTPALAVMARSYGLDGDKPDYEALAKAITSDPRHRHVQPRQYSAATDQEAALRSHYGSLVRQAEDMKQRYPDFDLQKELQNPAFARLTAPNVGIRVEDAYYTVHRREIESAALQTAARQTAQRISNAIRSGTVRPMENGSAAPAPTVTAFDYRNASREQREALKMQIRQAVARGEKIYPGSI